MCMSLTEAYDFFLSSRSSSCSSETINYYANCINKFYSFGVDPREPINKITKEYLHSYVLWLRESDIKNVSVRSYWRGLKCFFKFLCLNGVLHEDITSGILMPKDDSAQKMPLTQIDVDTLDMIIFHTREASRNYLIFHLLLDCGLRLQEVVNLDVSDINFRNRFLFIRNSKGCKFRYVPIAPVLLHLLEDYVTPYSGILPSSGSVFSVSSNAVKRLFARLQKYGIDVSAHLCRHTFATSYIFFGGSIEYLRILLGHSTYAVTERYIHLTNVVRVCQVPIYKINFGQELL